MATLSARASPVPNSVVQMHGSCEARNDQTIEVRLDRLRISEALKARDHAVYKMEELCASNRAKESMISKLQQDKTELEAKLNATHKIPGIIKVDLGNAKEKQDMEDERRRLQEENTIMKTRLGEYAKVFDDAANSPKTDDAFHTPSLMAKSPFIDEDMMRSPPIDIHSPLFSNPPEVPVPRDSEAVSQARWAILTNLPVPPEIPYDTLVPIVIPAPYTLQDFLGTASGSLKAQLANFRIFQECTTFWGSDREEHGYFVTPVFKCVTKPRVATAHQWTTADLTSGFDQPTECFYTKDGKWYYAGVYKLFRLRDVAPEEWSQLKEETIQALIKETLSHRKNTSPQNSYETGQLYAVGALKAACIGLQCTGFNHELYKGLLVLADICKKTGRWRTPMAGVGSSPPPWTTASAGASPNLG